jgi:hypothetical protein
MARGPVEALGLAADHPPPDPLIGVLTGYCWFTYREGVIYGKSIPAGSDVSAGTYRCTNCGHELEVNSLQSLPPCPSCANGRYETVSGGDSVKDPYPDRK